jgi:hypothetical protein
MSSTTNSHGDKAVTALLVEYLSKHLLNRVSMHQVSRATRIDWYTVRRLFRGQPRIFRPTSETRYAKWSLTPAAAKKAAGGKK